MHGYDPDNCRPPLSAEAMEELRLDRPPTHAERSCRHGVEDGRLRAGANTSLEPVDPSDEPCVEHEPSTPARWPEQGGVDGSTSDRSTADSEAAQTVAGGGQRAQPAGDSPVANLAFAFVTSGEQVEVMLAETPVEASSIHADLKAQRVGSQSPEGSANDRWLQAWNKEMKQVENSRTQRSAVTKKLPKPKKKKRA